MQQIYNETVMTFRHLTHLLLKDYNWAFWVLLDNKHHFLTYFMVK
jgi:hypothetical protein